MRSRLRRVSPVLVLVVLAVLAAVVAIAADHASWPMTTTFPWLHGPGEPSYVATKSQFDASFTAAVVAWVSAGVAVVVLLAAVVVAVLRRRGRGTR